MQRAISVDIVALLTVLGLLMTRVMLGLVIEHRVLRVEVDTPVLEDLLTDDAA